MRRLIYLVIACSIFCYALITETEFSNKEILQLQELDEKYTYSFSIPNNDAITNPDDLYKALLETSCETNANIIRTLFTDGENGYEVEKYVLLSDTSDYMSAFEIKCGRTLTIDDSRSKNNIFLSTKKNGGERQIGQIRSEMKGMDVTIYPLYAQFSYYKADGIYMVELGNNMSLQSFLEVLTDAINKYCETDIDDTSLQVKETSTVKLPYVDTFTLYLLQISLGIMLVLLFLYNIFYETKKLAVMRLFGNENHFLFWKYQKNFLYTTLLAVFISSIYIFVRYENFEYSFHFLCTVFVFAFIQFGIISVILLITMCRANILKGLKGGYSSNYVYYLNFFAKIICICVVIYSGQTVYNTLKDSVIMEEKMKSWKIADDYGIFYPYYIGFDMSIDEEKDCEITIGQDLYSYLNVNGALFVDTTQFEQEFQKLNGGTSPIWQFDVSVNPNYLKTFPLYDTDGKRIQINDEEEDLIFLVPEKYSLYEQEIVTYYKNVQLDKIETSRNYYGINCDSLKNQDIRIIWLKDNQGIFGFSTRVMSNEEGYIMNAVTHVVTEKNSTILDRIGILGKGELDPLKVFIGNYDNSNEAYNSLSVTLQKLNLDDNLKNMVSINENINERILELQAQRRIALTMTIVAMLLLCVLVVQNTILDFHRNKQKYIIEKIHGIHMLKIYGIPVFSSIVLYIVIGIVFTLLFSDGDSIYFISATLLLIAIQCAISIVSIMKLERKHISSVLKGA